MIKIYHNNRCSKSRACFQYLEDKNIEFETIEYLKNPLTKEEIKALLKKLNLSAFEMIRTQEAIYKEMYKGKDLSEEDYLQALCDHPKLLKRPIVEHGEQAVWAVPPESAEHLIK